MHKGYIKCVNVQPNRISYLITPRGIAEKARLTYEFMDYSLHLYNEVRQHLREALQECAAAGNASRSTAAARRPSSPICRSRSRGSSRWRSSTPTAATIFSACPVPPIAEHATSTYDLMIVAASIDRASRCRR